MKDFLFKINSVEAPQLSEKMANPTKVKIGRWNLEKRNYFVRKQHVCLTFSYKKLLKND
jgi:hypothetical protein